MSTLQDKLLGLRLPRGAWCRVAMVGRSQTIATLVKIGPRGGVKVADNIDKAFDKLIKVRVNILYGDDLRHCAPRWILKSDVEPEAYEVEL